MCDGRPMPIRRNLLIKIPCHASCIATFHFILSCGHRWLNCGVRLMAEKGISESIAVRWWFDRFVWYFRTYYVLSTAACCSTMLTRRARWIMHSSRAVSWCCQTVYHSDILIYPFCCLQINIHSGYFLLYLDCRTLIYLYAALIDSLIGMTL